jgi:hypothetical protein
VGSKGEKNPNYGKHGAETTGWKGGNVPIIQKYERHLTRPDLYPPLTEDEQEEYRRYWREYRKKKKS